MLNIRGQKKLSFLFPANLATTIDYYADMGRIASFLNHISIAESLDDDVYRMKYQSVEIAAYTITIFGDITLKVDREANLLSIETNSAFQPVEASNTLNTTTAQGLFNSQSLFHDAGDQTKIDFSLVLEADLPRPGAMRFMPKRIVNKITQGITNGRIQEISTGFIENSINAFAEWQAQQPV